MNTINKYQYRLLAVLTFWLICCIPIAAQFFHLDSNGYLPTVISSFVLVYLAGYRIGRLAINNPIVIFWGVLMGFHLIHNFFIDVPDEHNLLVKSIQQLLIMIFVGLMYTRNAINTFKVLIVTYMFYIIVAAMNPLQYSSRLSSVFLYVTQLGQMCGVLTLIISMYVVNSKHKVFGVLLYIIPIVIAFATQTRNGLLIMAFALLSLFVAYIKKNNLMIAAFLFVAAYLVLEYLKTTEFWLRFDTDILDSTYKTNTTLDYILGDRVYYYVVGFSNWLEHPFMGIGLYNFQNYNHGYFPIHAEFLTHLVEGGIIGGVIFICMYWYMLKHMLHNIGSSPLIQRQNLLNLFALLFLGLTARIFQYPFFFPIYGLVLGNIIKNQISAKNKITVDGKSMDGNTAKGDNRTEDSVTTSA